MKDNAHSYDVTKEQIEEFRREYRIVAHVNEPASAGLEPWAIEQNRILNALCDIALASLSGGPDRDGWKLVPIEPTEDMIDAGGEAPKMKIIDGYCVTAQLRGGFVEAKLAGPKSDCAIAQCYKAMLAAAPFAATKNDPSPTCPDDEEDQSPL